MWEECFLQSHLQSTHACTSVSCASTVGACLISMLWLMFNECCRILMTGQLSVEGFIIYMNRLSRGGSMYCPLANISLCTVRDLHFTLPMDQF